MSLMLLLTIVFVLLALPVVVGKMFAEHIERQSRIIGKLLHYVLVDNASM